ncbi:MAG: TetR/AcrR family transcriptional regulator [Mycobacterium sp.]|nr:TetR/AcrR family transcriptional regulator [Mycobacterium sp.]
MGVEGKQPGRRERKKQETRARLIDAAINLVDKQGYQRTTVGQIAEAVDVSPRTVAHYFPSKDKLLLAVVDAHTAMVVDEMYRVPDGLPPLRCLLDANLAALDRAASQNPPKAAANLASVLRTIHLSPPLQPLAFGLRSPELCVDLARRMNVEPDDRKVELVVAVWSALVNIAWSGVSELWSKQDDDLRNLPPLLHGRLTETYAQFLILTEGLVPATG